MKVELMDIEGNEITKETIRTALNEGRCILIWSHGNWENSAGVAIYDTPEDASLAYDKYETKGTCWSMQDETWTTIPSYESAVRAAAGALSVR